MNEQNGALGDAPSDSSKRLAEVKEIPKSSVGAWLSSDTLFGSICWAIRLTEDEQVLRQWLDRCQSDPYKRVLSSAFPFFGTDKPLHFLTKPLTLNLDVEMVVVAGNDRKKLLVTMRQAKAISKCAYVSETLFASSAKGELKESDLLEKVLDGEIEIIGGFILANSETNLLPKRLWSTTDIQHAVIDRVLTSAAEGLLYFDTEHFSETASGCFSFCVVPKTFQLTLSSAFGSTMA